MTQFECNGATYIGFTRHRKSRSEFFAVVIINNSITLWEIDWVRHPHGRCPKKSAVQELKRYYLEQFDQKVSVITYERHRTY